MKTWEEVMQQIKESGDEARKTLEEIEILTDIIAAIINKRIELGYSQRDLAKICKLPQSSIARIESFTVIPRINTLLQIMSPLGLTLSVATKNC
jgi:ribosome-binding protein aMBF1 (putative translation factor)